MYYSVIPNSVPAKTVFELINEETAGGMEGIIVSAHGDERMSDFFSTDKDLVYKACIDGDEISTKIQAGAMVGRLVLGSPKTEIHLRRELSKVIEDDCSVPDFAFYAVRVTLIDYPAVKDEQRVLADYARWLGPLEAPKAGNRFTVIYGRTKDVCLHYRLPCGSLATFFKKVNADSGEPLERSYGEVQEKGKLENFELDLTPYGFRGLFSVFPDWPVASVSNYPLDECERFCAAVDAAPKHIHVSVGRRYLAYRAQDGGTTRTLGGNQFSVYKTKTRRSLCIGFEQYSDADIPVRCFSGKIRAKLKEVGVHI